MFARLNRNIKAILVFLILLFIINILLNVFGYYFRDIIKIFEGIPVSFKFFIFFILQWIIIFVILLISLKINNIGIKYLIKKVKKAWNKPISFKSFIKYTILFYILTLMILSIINIIIYYLSNLGIYIPGFGIGAKDQQVFVLLKSLKLYNFLDYLIIFIVVGILAPFFEEIVYRVFITDELINYFGPFLGIFIGAYIFTLVHMEFKIFGNIFILSLILSYIWYKNKSLKINFLYHFLVNSISLLSLWMFL